MINYYCKPHKFRMPLIFAILAFRGLFAKSKGHELFRHFAHAHKCMYVVLMSRLRWQTSPLFLLTQREKAVKHHHLKQEQLMLQLKRYYDSAINWKRKRGRAKIAKHASADMAIKLHVLLWHFLVKLTSVYRNRGRPLLLEEYLDERVQIETRLPCWCCKSFNCVSCQPVAHGIVNHHEPSLLAVNGRSKLD